MTAVEKFDLVSIEDYLAGELESSIKHEYVGGFVHAMAGGTNRHSTISVNIIAALKQHLRGKRFQPFNSDTKVRIRQPHMTRFYYPDTMVVCHPNPESDTFQDEPVVIVEVLSDSTRRTDLGEKRDAYLSIPSLAVYLLVEPDEPAVRIFRRGPSGFENETRLGLDSVIELPEIEASLALSEIYENLAFETHS